MPDATDTARARSRLSYVLVLHDAEHPLDDICTALRRELIVRECLTAHEAFAELAARSYACVVCSVGGKIPAAEFHKLMSGSALGDVPTIFVCASDASKEDVDELERDGARCITARAPTHEIVEMVRTLRNSVPPARS